MKKVVVYGSAVLALSAAPLLAQQTSGTAGSTRQSSTGSATSSATQGGATTGTVASADRQFVLEAARGGMAEVELGRLATEKAQSDAVKQFGQRMVTDHGKANDELKSLAQSKNITLPTDLDATHKATKDRLSKLSGAAFDRAYMQDMVSDHQKDVNEFRKQSQSAKDPQIKAWAAKTLPTLQEHLQLAQAASRSAVGTSGTRSSGSPDTGATTPRGGSSTPGGGSSTPSTPPTSGAPGSSTPR